MAESSIKVMFTPSPLMEEATDIDQQHQNWLDPPVKMRRTTAQMMSQLVGRNSSLIWFILL